MDKIKVLIAEIIAGAVIVPAPGAGQSKIDKKRKLKKI